MTRHCVSTAVALAIVCAVARPVISQTRDRTALAGLEGVGIIVEKVADAAGIHGLTRTALLIDAELALGQAGIRVLPMTEYLDAPSAPYLHINLDATATPTAGLFAYAIDVQLRQDVLSAIVADTELYDVVTWRVRQDVRTVEANQLREVRAQVRELVAAFVADYGAANTK